MHARTLLCVACLAFRLRYHEIACGCSVRDACDTDSQPTVAETARAQQPHPQSPMGRVPLMVRPARLHDHRHPRDTSTLSHKYCSNISGVQNSRACCETEL